MFCTRLEGRHVNWNNVIYMKGTVHRTEIEGPSIAAKGFHTNLF